MPVGFSLSHFYFLLLEQGIIFNLMEKLLISWYHKKLQINIWKCNSLPKNLIVYFYFMTSAVKSNKILRGIFPFLHSDLLQFK